MLQSLCQLKPSFESQVSSATKSIPIQLARRTSKIRIEQYNREILSTMDNYINEISRDVLQDISTSEVSLNVLQDISTSEVSRNVLRI